MKLVSYEDVRKLIIDSNIKGRDYRDIMNCLDELPTYRKKEMTMTKKEAIEDLKTMKEYFEQESGATPICLEYAIKALEDGDD